MNPIPLSPANMDASEHDRAEILQPPRKRSRASQACFACRDRKTRCDGRRPVCRVCESRGIGGKCEYAAEDRRRRKREGSAANHGVEPNAVNSDTTFLPARPNTELQASDPAATGEQPWSSTHSDGLATLAGRNDTLLYGPSSTVDFIRNVISDKDTETAVHPSNLPNGSVANTRRRQRDQSQVLDRIPSSNESGVALPRRRSADDFVACFWDFIHPMFPVLNKTDFLRRYELFWANEGSSGNNPEGEDVVFVSTMYLVFALGCKFSSFVQSTQSSSVADGFYQQSRQLFHHDILDSASIPLVQALVLTGVYLQSTEHANRCWNAVGLAIRVAQSVGLHVDHGKTRSQVEREMRRRIWYTCVNLDRLLAMTFGRPTMIVSSRDVALPGMIDDEYLRSTTEGVQPADTPSRLGLFVSSCTLLELLGEVLSLHSDRQKTSKALDERDSSDHNASLIMEVLELNHRLNNFSNAVPAYLRIPENGQPFSSGPDYIKLQQQVLYCRFLLTRLLLFRPLLLLIAKEEKITSPVANLDGTEGSLLENDMLRKCCGLCIKTAYRLIDTIYDNLYTLYRSTGWHAVYFTFSAAIVLLASLKCRTLEIDTGDDSFESCWNRCLFILEHYKGQIHSAAHAIRSLNLIRGRIGKQSNMLTQRQQYVVPGPVLPDNEMPNDDMWSFFYADSNDPFVFDHISEAWFGPTLANLDWLRPAQT